MQTKHTDVPLFGVSVGDFSGRVGARLDDDAVIYETTQIFDALSDSTRFQILLSLASGEKGVGELIELCHVSQSAISHQLRLLRDRGIVVARRDGQRMHYSIADEHVLTLISVGLEHAAEARQDEDHS